MCWRNIFGIGFVLLSLCFGIGIITVCAGVFRYIININDKEIEVNPARDDFNNNREKSLALFSFYFIPFNNTIFIGVLSILLKK